MVCGVVFMPGVPGFPPGASWKGDGIDSLCNGPTNTDRSWISPAAFGTDKQRSEGSPQP